MAKQNFAGHIHTQISAKGRRQEWLGIDPIAYKHLLSQMSKLPKEIQNEIRDTSYRMANDLAAAVQREGYLNAAVGTAPPQAKLVARSAKPKRDRLISVNVGGPMKVGRPFRPLKTRKKKKGGGFTGPFKRASAGALLYGSEFGSSGGPEDWKGRKMGRRFVLRHRPYNLGSTDNGYWIHKAWRDFIPEAFAEWQSMVKEEIRKAGFADG